MKRFFLTSLATALILFSGCTEPDNNPQILNDEAYIVTDLINYVVDGDTIKFYDTGSVRLYGVDTPESYESDHLTRQADQCTSGDKNLIQVMGDQATSYTRSVLIDASYYDIQIMGSDIYDRTIGIVIIPVYGSLNKMLVRNGYAVPYFDTEEYYDDDLKFARTNRKGLWENYYDEMNCLVTFK